MQAILTGRHDPPRSPLPVPIVLDLPPSLMDVMSCIELPREAENRRKPFSVIRLCTHQQNFAIYLPRYCLFSSPFSFFSPGAAATRLSLFTIQPGAQKNTPAQAQIKAQQIGSLLLVGVVLLASLTRSCIYLPTYIHTRCC